MNRYPLKYNCAYYRLEPEYNFSLNNKYLWHNYAFAMAVFVSVDKGICLFSFIFIM